MTSRVSSPPVLLLLLLGATAACSPGSNGGTPDGSWVGTITTEDNVTTVDNQSGSVWGGAARLVEEASIGVETGVEEYMFGEISALHVADERIYLVDRSVGKVRVYDFDGTHLRSFGREGQGPGEIGGLPFDVAVGPEGRIYVGDFNNHRVNIYTPEGDPIDDIPLDSQVACCRTRLVFAEGGGVRMHVRINDAAAGTRRDGVRVFTVDGPVGEITNVPEIEYDRRTLNLGGREVAGVPFAASLTWNLAYDGSIIVGASDRYRFRIIQPSGGVIEVQRYWDPVRISADEAGYWTRLTRAQFSGVPDLSWNGENIPDHKPAFVAFLPARSGEIWVVRHGPVPPDACSLPPEEMAATQDPIAIQECMLGDLIVDVFDRDGRYLGNVEGFPYLLNMPFVDGDTLVAAIQDDAGTVLVKRYRLMPPDREAQ